MAGNADRLNQGLGALNALLGITVAATPWVWGLSPAAIALAGIAGLAIAGLGGLNAVLARELTSSRWIAAGNLALGHGVAVIPAAVATPPAAMAVLLTAGVLVAAGAGVVLTGSPEGHLAYGSHSA